MTLYESNNWWWQSFLVSLALLLGVVALPTTLEIPAIYVLASVGLIAGVDAVGKAISITINKRPVEEV